MEFALLVSFTPLGLKIYYSGLVEMADGRYVCDVVNVHPDYEEYLFNGMVSALEVLKQIHIEHGEIIDDAPMFVKRQII